MAGAEKIYNEVIEIDRRVFGEDHPETASAMENLGNVMYQTGRPAETIKMLEQVLAIRKRAFGEESEAVPHPCQSRHGQLHQRKPRSRRAALPRGLRDDAEIPRAGQSRRLGGPPRTGPQLPPPRPARQAETHLRRSLKIRLAAFGEDSSQVARVRFLIGKVLIDTKDPKRYPEADQLLQLADASSRKSGGVANPATQQAIQARVDLYKAWGKPEKAKPLEAELTAKTP